MKDDLKVFPDALKEVGNAIKDSWRVQIAMLPIRRPNPYESADEHAKEKCAIARASAIAAMRAVECQNRQKIRAQLKRPSTVNELIKSTGLSRETIRKHLCVLIETKEAELVYIKNARYMKLTSPSRRKNKKGMPNENH